MWAAIKGLFSLLPPGALSPCSVTSLCWGPAQGLDPLTLTTTESECRFLVWPLVLCLLLWIEIWWVRYIRYSCPPLDESSKPRRSAGVSSSAVMWSNWFCPMLNLSISALSHPADSSTKLEAAGLRLTFSLPQQRACFFLCPLKTLKAPLLWKWSRKWDAIMFLSFATRTTDRLTMTGMCFPS